MAPNKHSAAGEQVYKGHLLESETYIGGKVQGMQRVQRGRRRGGQGERFYPWG